MLKDNWQSMALIFVVFFFGVFLGSYYNSSYDDGRYDGYHQGADDTFTYVDVMMKDDNWTVSEFDREYGIYYYVGASRFPNDARFDGIPKMRLFDTVIWDGVNGWFP